MLDAIARNELTEAARRIVLGLPKDADIDIEARVHRPVPCGNHPYTDVIVACAGNRHFMAHVTPDDFVLEVCPKPFRRFEQALACASAMRTVTWEEERFGWAQ